MPNPHDRRLRRFEKNRLAVIEREITQLRGTVDRLKANGHLTRDAEKHLQSMVCDLDFFRTHLA
jgi:hypothetical protein